MIRTIHYKYVAMVLIRLAIAADVQLSQPLERERQV
jgi:hypothetical protein